MPIFQRISGAQPMLLDRWSISSKDLDAGPTTSTSVSQQLSRLTHTKSSAAGGRKEVTMCNYFGIGVDAAVALDFHEMRQSSPHLFFSRLVNKLWYAKSGAKTMILQNSRKIASKMTLECDGEQIQLPPTIKGIVVLNVSSYGGGADLWGDSGGAKHDDDDDDEVVGRKATCDVWGMPSNTGEDDGSSDVDSDVSNEASKFTHPSMEDKKLEVVGVHGTMSLGAAQIGLYKAKKLCQASSVRIRTSADLAVQADGEPWRFAANGEITISHKGQALMLGHSPQKSPVAATEIVEWGLQTHVIQPEQHQKLVMEIAKRRTV